ncbi:hypothetical protein F5879DRAFT_971031 [Lentinula edodes]|nr:hypothetical protein F5879DRAFT_971031 [Lentinula edodes]
MTDSNLKPHSQSSDKRRKRKYLSDGISSKRYVDGPGVWVSCVRGKERQTVGELYDLFHSVAADLWPIEDTHLLKNSPQDTETREESEVSIEEQINAEVIAIKRPKSDQKFASCQTNTPCVVFISCKSPVDPVQLVETHIQNVKSTGAARTRYTHRFVPVSATCYADLSDMQTLCKSVLQSYLAKYDETFSHTYKIELRMRNHTNLTRSAVIEAIAECVPERCKVNLTNPELFLLVEIFKSVCGMSITTNYYALHKYNVTELANDYAQKDDEGSRVPGM